MNLSYNTIRDAGQQLYCFTTANGQESPTLHVQPGDFLTINLKNNLPKPVSAGMTLSNSTVCGDTTLDASSVNMHFHGVNAPPSCQADEVIYTPEWIPATRSRLQFPDSYRRAAGAVLVPPPCTRASCSEAARAFGGASGAIVVDGIENVQTAVSGLPERILMIRDQVPLATTPPPGGGIPSWDISVNYVPILWPNFKPAAIFHEAGRKGVFGELRIPRPIPLRIFNCNLTACPKSCK